jgi:hypothetical protein
MARRHHRRASKAGKTTHGGKRHHLLSSKGHRAPPFAKKGGRYSSMSRDDGMHRPDDTPLIRSDDAAMANVAP